MIVVAITGASGVIYGIRLLEALKDLNIENSLVISDAGKTVIESETSYSVEDVIALADEYYDFDDLTAEDASLMQTTLGDAFSVWDDAFVRGTKDIEADWDAYVEEMKDKGIDEFLSLYNEYNKYR